ncbi:alpha/beta hydrolase family protein [Aliidiomarina minuta]|uniref:alpha/beta hydrolase family protein n=1 Tax=Aliidiomarina minuta TaxID=880057 RepID=UPI0013008236|nr:prolyl oligopeptidase family serine peptidase [Aliidiomarina minuta]
MNYDATCYSAPHDTYDNLIDAWVERNRNNPGLNRTYFEEQVSRSDFDSVRQTIDCRWLVYQHGPYQIGGFMLKPYDDEIENLPVIIYNREGYGSRGSVSFRQLITELAPYVEAGFVVIGSQYKGGGGVFPNQRNGDDEFGGADVASILALLDIIDQDSKADVSRVGLLGSGRGSMMSFLAARNNDSFKAIASVRSLTNLEAWIDVRAANERVAAQYIPDYDSSRLEALAQRSVTEWAGDISSTTPVLLLHGARDRQIPPEQSQQLAEIFASQGHPHRLQTYSHGDHNLRGYEGHVRRDVIEWFKEYL